MLIPFEKRPRFALLEGRTPIQRLMRLEKALSCSACPPIYVKRDDLMGIGGGGNKLRKLEFLIGEALDQGCDTFITTGARQSNHARLSAAAAARAGLSCELVLTDTVARDDEAYRRNGNVLLDDLFGATVLRRAGDVDALKAAKERAADLSTQRRRAYLMTQYGMTPDQYRQRWNLPADYPMLAPEYAEKRRALAKTIGLGRKPGERPSQKTAQKSGRKSKAAPAAKVAEPA